MLPLPARGPLGATRYVPSDLIENLELFAFSKKMWAASVLGHWTALVEHARKVLRTNANSNLPLSFGTYTLTLSAASAMPTFRSCGVDWPATYKIQFVCKGRAT